MSQLPLLSPWRLMVTCRRRCRDFMPRGHGGLTGRRLYSTLVALLLLVFLLRAGVLQLIHDSRDIAVGQLRECGSQRFLVMGNLARLVREPNVLLLLCLALGERVG